MNEENEKENLVGSVPADSERADKNVVLRNEKAKFVEDKDDELNKTTKDSKAEFQPIVIEWKKPFFIMFGIGVVGIILAYLLKGQG